MRKGVVYSLATSLALGAGALALAHLAGGSRAGPARAVAAPAPTVPVVVASTALAYGDPVRADRLTVVRFPQGLAPQGAFASVAQLEGAKGPPPSALAAIAPREPVLPSMITGPGGRNAVSAEIAPGMRAYTIKISDVLGVGGHALPGDHVDVVLTREPPHKAGTPAPDHELISDVVVQDVRLLGVNLNIDPASTATQAATDPRTATLEVGLQDAQRLAVAGGVGTLSLALRPAGAAEIVPARQVLVNDLAPGGEPKAPTVRRVTRPHAPPAEAEPHVLIVHGDHDASVKVPAEKQKGA